MILGRVLEYRKDDHQIQFVSGKYFEERFIKVKMPHVSENDYLLAQVSHVESRNEYFEHPRAFKTIGNKEENVKAQSIFVSFATVLGHFSARGIRDFDFPPLPGEAVLSASDSDVSLVLGLPEDGITVGRLKQKEQLPVQLNLEALTRTHFSILGKTGAGKSVFTETLLSSVREEMNFVIFSPTDEYNHLADDDKGINLYKWNQIHFPLKNDFVASILDLNMTGKKMFESFLNSNIGKQLDSVHSSKDIATSFNTWITNQVAGNETQTSLNFKLRKNIKVSPIAEEIESKLSKLHLVFSKHYSINFTKGSKVFDLTGIPSEAQELIVGYVTKQLFRSRQAQDDKKILVIVEEAHNYAPSTTRSRSKHQLIQIGREGRKLGLSLCLISQRPRYIDQTILAQCSNLFLFHLPHPDDLNHVFSFASSYDSELTHTAKQLGTGECLVIGDLFRHPIVCQVNQTKPKG